MSARATMADLVDAVRGLMGDPDGADRQFDYQAIQDALDRQRRLVRYEELIATPTMPVGGALAAADYLQYRSYSGNWEEGETLYDSDYTTLAVTTADRLTGHWTLATGVEPPVYITGVRYDVFAAAADLLTAWVAASPFECLTSVDGVVTVSTAKAESRRTQAAALRARRGPVGSW